MPRKRKNGKWIMRNVKWRGDQPFAMSHFPFEMLFIFALLPTPYFLLLFLTPAASETLFRPERGHGDETPIGRPTFRY